MPFQPEVLRERSEARQEGLDALQMAKASDATLSLWRGRWLMVVLCAVADLTAAPR
jgi:hypothetical protein